MTTDAIPGLVSDCTPSPSVGRASSDDLAVLELGSAEALTLAALAVSNRGGHILLGASLGDAPRVAELLHEHERAVTMVDATDIDGVGASVDELCQAIVIDSLTSDATLVDIGTIAELCHSHDIALIVDNGRLSMRVINPVDLGATLTVCPRRLGHDALTEVTGPAFPMSLVRRLAALAGVRPSTTMLASPAAATTRADPAMLAALPAVSQVTPLDWSTMPWASEVHTNLDDLLIVTLTAARQFPHAVCDAPGMAQLTPGTVLVHRAWGVDDWSARLSRALSGQSQHILPAEGVSERTLAFASGRDIPPATSQGNADDLVSDQPWASQWTSRVEVTAEANAVVARLLPSVWASSRLVRPFEVRLRPDADSATDLLVAAVAAETAWSASPGEVVTATLDRAGLTVSPQPIADVPGVAAATVAHGLPLIGCVHDGRSAERLRLSPAASEVPPARASARRSTAEHQLIDVLGTTIHVDRPWQAGGLDRGPDPGELVLLALGLDLGLMLASASAADWSILLEARRDLRRAGGAAGLTDAVAYLVIDPQASIELNPETVSRAWSSSVVRSALTVA